MPLKGLVSIKPFCSAHLQQALSLVIKRLAELMRKDLNCSKYFQSEKGIQNYGNAEILVISMD
jgi:hypothetical protein